MIYSPTDATCAPRNKEDLLHRIAFLSPPSNTSTLLFSLPQTRFNEAVSELLCLPCGEVAAWLSVKRGQRCMLSLIQSWLFFAEPREGGTIWLLALIFLHEDGSLSKHSAVGWCWPYLGNDTAFFKHCLGKAAMLYEGPSAIFGSFTLVET